MIWNQLQRAFNEINNLMILPDRNLQTEKNNIAKVPTVIIPEETILIQRLCSSSFDELYYIFNNELFRLGNATAQGNRDIRQLLDKSFLMGKGFQFGIDLFSRLGNLDAAQS